MVAATLATKPRGAFASFDAPPPLFLLAFFDPFASFDAPPPLFLLAFFDPVGSFGPPPPLFLLAFFDPVGSFGPRSRSIAPIYMLYKCVAL